MLSRERGSHNVSVSRRNGPGRCFLSGRHTRQRLRRSRRRRCGGETAVSTRVGWEPMRGNAHEAGHEAVGGQGEGGPLSVDVCHEVLLAEDGGGRDPEGVLFRAGCGGGAGERLFLWCCGHGGRGARRAERGWRRWGVRYRVFEAKPGGQHPHAGSRGVSRRAGRTESRSAWVFEARYKYHPRELFSIFRCVQSDPCIIQDDRSSHSITTARPPAFDATSTGPLFVSIRYDSPRPNSKSECRNHRPSFLVRWRLPRRSSSTQRSCSLASPTLRNTPLAATNKFNKRTLHSNTSPLYLPLVQRIHPIFAPARNLLRDDSPRLPYLCCILPFSPILAPSLHVLPRPPTAGSVSPDSSFLSHTYLDRCHSTRSG